jgi:hypothetical protein
VPGEIHLRHTCASLAIAAGAHPKLISARLGHSSIQITLDRYSHLFPSVEEALAEALDAIYSAGECGGGGERGRDDSRQESVMGARKERPGVPVM